MIYLFTDHQVFQRSDDHLQRDAENRPGEQGTVGPGLARPPPFVRVDERRDGVVLLEAAPPDRPPHEQRVSAGSGRIRESEWLIFRTFSLKASIVLCI